MSNCSFSQIVRRSKVAATLRFETLEQHHPALKAYLGQGWGFSWYGCGPACYLQYVARGMSLSGGEGLSAEIGAGLLESGPYSYECATVFATDDGSGLPHIKLAVARATNQDLHACGRALGANYTDACTDFIIESYGDSRPKVREMAAYALTFMFRERARNCYLDMLKRGPYPTHAAYAAVKFGWKESFPLIEAAMDRPGSFSDFAEFFTVKRSFEGNPVPSRVWRAAPMLGGAGDGAKSALTMVEECKDKETVAVVALMAAMSSDKESEQVAGLALLRELPKDIVLPLIRRLVSGVRSKRDVGRLAQLLRQVGG